MNCAWAGTGCTRAPAVPIVFLLLTVCRMISDHAALRADEVKTVLCEYGFKRCKSLTRTTAQGQATQCAMTLTRKIDPAETVTVVWTTDDMGDDLWFVTDISRARFEAGQRPFLDCPDVLFLLFLNLIKQITFSLDSAVPVMRFS